MSETKERVITKLKVTFRGDPGCTARQVYTNNGLKIESGETKTFHAGNLPDDFPLTLADLYAVLRKTPGMEVKGE